ncbi:MAG TPA: HEAT repeat domain-containing protein [Pyrinomonadaceae bacterium]|nr:HEAT repeat domain-containing protein [Pyrinomonadaceae bacterium]
MDGDNSNGNRQGGAQEAASRASLAARQAGVGSPQTGIDSAQMNVARRRSPWPLAVVAALFIILPFLSWYSTTFWRELDDEEIEKYLNDDQKPRHVQHALEEIDRRIVKGDQSVRRWYPQVLRVAGNPLPDIRMAAAWMMGDDNKSVEFHAALKQLVRDEDPAVRRMAALSLSRFNDADARAELLAMLRPYSLRPQFGRTVITTLPSGSAVSRGALVARVRDEKNLIHEVRAPVAGKIERASAVDGAFQHTGEELLVLAPDGKNVWEALRALSLVGTAEDLPDIERYARGEVGGMSEEIKQLAALTAEIIRSRAVGK